MLITPAPDLIKVDKVDLLAMGVTAACMATKFWQSVSSRHRPSRIVPT
jgi:hypothetical protein